ncbi:MAG: histidine kinase, partial [Chloroflexi bacterium]|nr:histidine kinase [Chloroflexota bacterium]
RDLNMRHLVVERVTTFFTFQQQQDNKFILTSRIVGYREVRPNVPALAECTLVDFDDDEIALFVGKWTSALEKAATGDNLAAQLDAAQERQDLLDALRHNPGVRRLAANPLLLTILALMKRQGVTLPERRVELYEQYVRTLLKHWNLARGLDGRVALELDVGETVKALAPLALWMHETSPGVGLVKREAVRRQLEAIYAAQGEAE